MTDLPWLNDVRSGLEGWMGWPAVLELTGGGMAAVVCSGLRTVVVATSDGVGVYSTNAWSGGGEPEFWVELRQRDARIDPAVAIGAAQTLIALAKTGRL